MQLRTAVLAALATLSTIQPAAADDPATFQADLPLAIRVLYGEGVTVTVSPDKKSVTLDWDRKRLSPAKLQQLIETYYVPRMTDSVGNAIHLDSMLAFSRSRPALKKAGGHILIEPHEKLAICRDLAKRIDGFDREKEMQQYCARRAIETANAPVYAFRGSRVTYPLVEDVAGISFNEPLFVRRGEGRDVVITVAGPRRLDDHRTAKVLEGLANSIPYDAGRDLVAVAARVRAHAQELAKTSAARIARRDAKVAGKRGAVVFTDDFIEGWQPIEPLPASARPSCWDSFVHIYGPAARGSYDVTVRTNGTRCSNDIYSGGFAEHWSVVGTCKPHLSPGTNRIEVAISRNVNKLVGKRWDPAKRQNVKIYSNKPGKRVATNKLTCRFED